MSYKLKLGVALGVAALALPTFAFAQDPSTRTDLTIVGAVSSDRLEQIADANATSVAEMPVVYEDEAETANADASATDSTADAAAEAE
ncbi:MAG: hypothetical protein ACK4X1_03090 [Terricaulis sp.]